MSKGIFLFLFAILFSSIASGNGDGALDPSYNQERLRKRTDSKVNCSYCHGTLESDDSEAPECLGCGAIIHNVCRQELLAPCTSLFCDGKARIKMSDMESIISFLSSFDPVVAKQDELEYVLENIAKTYLYVV